MAEPSTRGFGAPVRRPVGRLGPVVLLVLGVVALAAMTHAQALDRVAPADPADTAGDAADPSGTDDPGRAADPTRTPTALAFGSTTAAGAIVFRLGEPVHAWAVDATGAPRWERDLGPGEALACDPCPEAILTRADGSVRRVLADGSTGPPPVALADGATPARSVTGVVVAAPRADGGTEFLVPTADGLSSAGSLDGARLDQPLVVVTPASGGGAVTLLRASSDPLRQAEFEVVHVTPSGSALRTVGLDEPGARPYPCAVADAGTVAYLQQLTGPTSAGSTHLVVRTDDGPGVEATVEGTFDSCAAGSAGAVLASAVTGADGDPTRTSVDLVWLGAALDVRATAVEPVAGPRASVALDPRSSSVAVGGGAGAVVVLDGRSRSERAPAAAVAFDDRGGLWSVDAEGRVSHEVVR